jgi:hypothetical protein
LNSKPDPGVRDLSINGALQPPAFEGGLNRLSHAWLPRRGLDPALQESLRFDGCY